MPRRVWLFIAALTASCGQPTSTPQGPNDPEFVALCTDDFQCPSGQFCVAGACAAERPVRPTPDAGFADSGVTEGRDAGFRDAGTTRPRDAGMAPPRDAGVRDAGSTTGPTIDLSGWSVVNYEHDPPIQSLVFPAGTVLEPGQHLLLVRGVDRIVFEEELAVSLGNAIFIRTDARSNGIPIVNGGESWAVVDDTGTIVDGPTIVGGEGYSYRRRNTGDASDMSNWVVGGEVDDIPGSTLLPSSGVGVRIAQWSDESGTGRYVYEYVELYYAP